MTVRAAVLSLSLAMVSAASAIAQTASPTGSLTLMSRPVGASFRIVGDQGVVGRTPVTLDRGLAGRYRASGSEIGYEPWSRSLVLDGVTSVAVGSHRWFVVEVVDNAGNATPSNELSTTPTLAGEGPAGPSGRLSSPAVRSHTPVEHRQRAGTDRAP